MAKTVVYSGTFDPVTLGHVDLVERALHLFDEVVIAVSTGTGKKPLFSLDERVALIRRIFADNPRVRVEPFDGLLVDFVARCEAVAVLRGLRAVSDFEYEFQMAAINRRLNRRVETIFLTPSEAYSYLSSTMIREVANIDLERIADMVPAEVMTALERKFSR